MFRNVTIRMWVSARVPNVMPACFFLKSWRRIVRPEWLTALLICLLCGSAAHGSSLVYKNYIVRYDRGWDIMCERYIVQKNDWVLKIFRQKGEIANQDFREFLGIFERLNPHIRDIDLIQPGQSIDIPLRKLEHGSLPGQASGVVTIPFVTLSKVEDVIQQHAKTYTVQRGDTVSKLIARQYGRFGSQGYQEGIKLFQAANPQVTDLNVIYAGQTVSLPEASIRDESWYASLYDEQGNLRKTVNKNQPPAAEPKPVLRMVPPMQARKEESRPDRQPGSLAQAAATVGGNFMEKGTYYLPRPGAEDFEIDLSRHPLLQVPDAPKLLFAKQGRIMDMTAENFERQWPDAKIVAYNEQSSTEEIIGAIFDALEPNDSGGQGAEISFIDRIVRVTVRSKWIKPESGQRHLCITPINDSGEKTPESLRRYLEQNGIILKEILPGGETAATAKESAGQQRHAVKNVLALAPTSPKDFVQSLARALGFSYTPNVGITFPYGGMQITAFSNLFSAGDGREVLVDYGDFYGDALTAIRNSGPQVIQIAPEDSYAGIVARLFKTMNLDYMVNPVFQAVPRSSEFNTEISIDGVLLSTKQEKRILLTTDQMHPAVTDIVSSQGIDMIVWP